MERHKESIGMLIGVIEGTRVAHVWRSPFSPGADMTIQYRWRDVEVHSDEHGLPASIAKDVELTYEGIMTADEAAQKLASMRIAESGIGSAA